MPNAASRAGGGGGGAGRRRGARISAGVRKRGLRRGDPLAVSRSKSQAKQWQLVCWRLIHTSADLPSTRHFCPWIPGPPHGDKTGGQHRTSIGNVPGRDAHHRRGVRRAGQGTGGGQPPAGAGAGPHRAVGVRGRGVVPPRGVREGLGGSPSPTASPSPTPGPAGRKRPTGTVWRWKKVALATSANPLAVASGGVHFLDCTTVGSGGATST